MTPDIWPTSASLLPRWKARFARNAPAWLVGKGDWPLSWPLQPPTEKSAALDTTRTADWVRSWRDWDRRHGEEAVQWTECNWPRLGRQRLPKSVNCHSPAELASWIGESARWRRAKARADSVLARWPTLVSVVPRHFTWLADEEENEFRRHLVALSWIIDHPHSGLYPRQLPIPGVDSKWLERRRAWLKQWLGVLAGELGPHDDLYALLGLRRLPAMLPMRVKDPALRAWVGGLSHVECPAAEAATLRWPIRSVLVVENRQSGLAVEPSDGVVVVMALGYALDELASLPWMSGVRVGYWSDLDTHGFAMLNRMRAHFPQTESLLMDADTMSHHHEFWVPEPDPHPAGLLPNLTPEEQATYQRFHRDWKGKRLEQERIGWPYVLSIIHSWMA